VNRRNADLFSIAPFTVIVLAGNVLIYIYTSMQSGSFSQTSGEVSLQLFDSRREGLWEGQWLRLIAPNFLHGGFMHILFNSYALFQIGPAAEIHFGSSNFGTIYLLSGVAGFCFSQIFGGYPALGASAALFGLYGAELAVVVLRAPVLKYAWRNSEVRAYALNMLIYLAIGFSGMLGRVDNWAHLGGLAVGCLLGAFFELWRSHRRLGPVLVLCVLIVVGGLVAAARWSVFNPYYHVHQALLARDDHRDEDMQREIAEARKWAKVWHREFETNTFIAWVEDGSLTREVALRTTYGFQAQMLRMRRQQREQMTD
jgi:membrane associated rhomboid family serine protease